MAPNPDEVARDVAAFRRAVQARDGTRVREMLALPHVRAQLDSPVYPFGQRAVHYVARDIPTLDALREAGADLSLASEWENGPFTALDHADDASARYLIEHGVPLTAHAAARLGWYDELLAILDRAPDVIHARGGDGQQPLHQARTAAIADLLLDRGAGIDVPCIDHHSTPAQYALAERPDVCRRLLERGARPDIFMAARLGDLALATRLVADDSACVSAYIDEPGYAPVPPFSMYCWTLGSGRSPHDIARASGHEAVYTLLLERSPLPVRFVNAALSADEAETQRLLDQQPDLVATLSPAHHGRLARAIASEAFDAADLMLRLGFDPATPGLDGGTSLHVAAWMGHVDFVDRLLAMERVPVDALDPTHHTTPLGWAAYGSVHRRSRRGDYVAVVEHLVAAGARVDPPAPGARTFCQLADGNPEVQATLRRLGAT